MPKNAQLPRKHIKLPKKKTMFTDLALFEALVSLIVAHAALSTEGTADFDVVIFYVIVLVMNLVALILIYVFTGDEGQLVDYHENLTPSAFVYILAGIAGVFFTALIIVSQFKASSIFVPTFTAISVTSGATSLMWSVVYNFGLVANAEETTKLVGINAIYMYLTDNFEWIGKDAITGISVVVPVGFWALLHAYVAYVGPYCWPLVLSAFIAGLIMFVVMYKTKSLLAAICVHGTYNVIVDYGAQMGWFNMSNANSQLALTPIYLVVLVALYTPFLILNIRHRKCQRMANSGMPSQ